MALVQATTDEGTEEAERLLTQAHRWMMLSGDHSNAGRVLLNLSELHARRAERMASEDGGGETAPLSEAKYLLWQRAIDCCEDQGQNIAHKNSQEGESVGRSHRKLKCKSTGEVTPLGDVTAKMNIQWKMPPSIRRNMPPNIYGDSGVATLLPQRRRPPSATAPSGAKRAPSPTSAPACTSPCACPPRRASPARSGRRDHLGGTERGAPSVPRLVECL